MCSYLYVLTNFYSRRIYKYLHNLHGSHNLTQNIACGDTDAIKKANQGFRLLFNLSYFIAGNFDGGNIDGWFHSEV